MNIERGSLWQRKHDAKRFEVVYVYAGRIQFRRAGATNLKNTRWLSEESFLARYQPDDTSPRTFADELRERLGFPEQASVSANVGFGYRRQPWGHHAVAFVERAENASWSWLHVPANGDDWWSLSLRGDIDGLYIDLSGPGGWTRVEANQLHSQLKSAKANDDESRTPFPYAYKVAV